MKRIKLLIQKKSNVILELIYHYIKTWSEFVKKKETENIKWKTKLFMQRKKQYEI